jgi:large subunit ribosomal protein L23
MGIFGKTKEDQIDADAQAVVPAKKSSEKKGKTAKKDDVHVSVALAYNVIVGPVITEKAHALSTKGQYVFRVNTDADKKQVKDVVEKMYNVTVEDVRMIVVKPKRRTVKYDRGYQKKFKKAVVTVKSGQSIAVFQGV